MRKSVLTILWAVAVLAACDSATEPRNFTTVGTWESVGFEDAELQMTLTETARQVMGAGSWVSPERAISFEVEGAHVETRVSLSLQLESFANINFRGEFPEDSVNVMRGAFYGSGYNGEPIRFRRLTDEDD